MLPPHIVECLDGWGPSLRDVVAKARAEALPDVGSPWPTAPIRVSTDCSGLEAPLWALEACGVSHVHTSSCEIAPAQRRFIQANCRGVSRPGFRFFSDILLRDPAEVPQHDLYVAGFPCTPFSLLHHRSKLMKDPNARQFRACVRTIVVCKLALAVLEDVERIRRVLPQVLRVLR